MLTLCNALFSEIVAVEVATTNVPALHLYERLGFQTVADLISWYDVNT
jgi:ribosomal protein S18 acetylase RimI-like enzyme